MRRLASIAIFFVLSLVQTALARTDDFRTGVEAYRDGRCQQAAETFHRVTLHELSSGALLNLGNAQWKCGRTGEAIVAWEQALWLNPFDHNARNNLRFARDAAQLESPELTWYEIASGWLPVNWWAWITGLSLWFAVAAMVLPGVLRWPRAAGAQAVAALGFGVFLLCVPAHFGTVTRTNLGFVLRKDTALRLTPTAEGEVVTRLAAGDPVRRIRTRGKFVLVRTRNSTGWLSGDQVALIAGR